jgi:hypothetical protein
VHWGVNPPRPGSVLIPAQPLQIMLSPEARNTAWVSFDGRKRQEIRHGDRCGASGLGHWLTLACDECGHVGTKGLQQEAGPAEARVSHLQHNCGSCLHPTAPGTKPHRLGPGEVGHVSTLTSTKPHLRLPQGHWHSGNRNKVCHVLL